MSNTGSLRFWWGPANRPAFARSLAAPLCSLLAISMAMASGCGERSGLEKVIVTGEVTYQGQPIADGDIKFEPMPNTKGPLSGARIKNGRYTVKAKGGVPVGEHVVRIRGFRSTAGDGADLLSMTGKNGSGGGQFLPEKYNNRSQEVVTIDGGRSKVTVDFHLQ